MLAAVVVSFLAVAMALGVGGCLSDATEDAAKDSDEQLANLEERPLELPRIELSGPSIRAGGIAGRCVGSEGVGVGAIGLPGVPGEAALGPGPGGPELEEGPVYAMLLAGAPRVAHLQGLRRPRGSRWRAIKTIWVSRPAYDGPVLVRGERIEQPGRVGFGSARRPRWQLELPAGSWPRNIEPRGRGSDELERENWRFTSVPTRIRTPGCYAFQVDGHGFSYVLAFGVQ